MCEILPQWDNFSENSHFSGKQSKIQASPQMNATSCLPKVRNRFYTDLRSVVFMRKMYLFMTTSVDGFVGGPNNELDWMMQTPDDEEMQKDTMALLNDADTGVIGYPTGVGMVPYWRNAAKDPSASQSEREMGQAIGKMHVILVSNKVQEIEFENVELLVARTDEELVDAVGKLKRQPGKDIGVPGGVRTAQTFSRLGLFDEYVLMIHPVAIGDGKRIFTKNTNLALVSVKNYKNGVIQVRYRPRKSTPTSSSP